MKFKNYDPLEALLLAVCKQHNAGFNYRLKFNSYY